MASDLAKELEAAFRRLGLAIHDMPFATNDLEPFIAHVRSLQPGASWHDVFPDAPAHWVPGRPETWTTRYRPFGPYDYQELPTGPALHLQWDGGVDQSLLDAFVGGSRETGWPVYGAGLIAAAGPDRASTDAFVILARGTAAEQLHEFCRWVETQPGIRVAACPRVGDEAYHT